MAATSSSGVRARSTLGTPAGRAVVVGLAYLALALHGLDRAHIVGDDEAREVGIVRDVVAGHWLWPTFNGTGVPDKPTLYHWLAALPVGVAGFSETSVRLVSALAAAATVGWTLVLGSRLLSPMSGLLAALVLATTPTLLDHARVARPDTLLVLCLTVALGAAFAWWRDRRPRDAAIALAATGLGVLAKGPVAPALFGVALVGFLLWQRELRRLPRLLTPAGVLAFLVLAAGWYVLAWAGWGDAFVEQHLLGRYLRNLAGGLARGEAYSPKSWLYHLSFYPLHLPAIAMPWTPFLAAALWRLWRSGGFADPRARFLLCWALAPVVVFTPAEWKLRYYLLPALPALALLVAPTLALALGPSLRRLRVTWPSAAAGALAVVGTLAAAWVGLAHPEVLSNADREVLAALLPLVPGGRSGLAVVAGLGAGVLGVTIACQAWGALATLTFAVTLAWMTTGMPLLEQATSGRDSFKAFAEVVATRFPGDRPLAFYARPVRSIVAYVGRPIPTLRRRATRIEPGQGIIALAPAHAALEASGYVGPVLAAGAGRVGNLGRSTLVLGEGREPPPPSVGRPGPMRYGPGDE